MKKFFVAVCCVALVGMNVSAQEPQIVGEAAQSIIVAPDTDSILASSVEETAPAAVETPVVEAPVANAVVELGQVTEGYAIEGSVIDNGMVAQPFEQTYTAAPVNADCGCGQAAPVVDYNAGYAPVVDYNGGYAPVVEAGCSSCGQVAPVATDCCCEAGRTRPQVISRVRGRFTSVRGVITSRRNDDCCCN